MCFIVTFIHSEKPVSYIGKRYYYTDHECCIVIDEDHIVRFPIRNVMSITIDKEVGAFDE